MRRFAFPSPLNSVSSPVISPNGRHIAYNSDNTVRVRDLDQEDPRALSTTAGAREKVFWSPDSRWIGYATTTELRKVPVEGGRPIRLCALPAPLMYDGGAWNPDGESIIFGCAQDIYEVSSQGGEPRLLRGTRSEEQPHIKPPVFVPDSAQGGRILFSAAVGSGYEMYVRELETGDEH
ncbi:MAG: hypothetical protein GY953_00260, partial [bacterium]|nr:hypothetical protein [bacterium]